MLLDQSFLFIVLTAAFLGLSGFVLLKTQIIKSRLGYSWSKR